MIAALAAAALLTAAPDLTGEEVGRLAFTAGWCSEMGWSLNDSGGLAVLEQYSRDNPGVSEEQAAAEIDRGVDLTEAAFESDLDALTDRRSFLAWAGTLERSCDDLAGRFPEVLSRTDQTAAVFGETIGAMAKQFPE